MMRRASAVACLVLTVAVLGACTAPTTMDQSTAPGSPTATASVMVTGSPTRPATVEGPLKVTKVVDGDTIWVRRGGDRVKLRLIGIDTPETVDPNAPIGCFGPQASAKMTDLLKGQQVYLETDPSQAKTDRYGRELVYVWTADGTLVNLAMIEGGFARERTYAAPYAYRDEFLAAQAQAKAASAGMWGIDGCAS